MCRTSHGRICNAARVARDFDGRRFGFRACGDDVVIYEWVRVIDPGRITVGSHVIVDDFVFIDGGQSLTIGSHVHIAGDLPPWSICHGIPARVVRARPRDTVDELERRLLAAEGERA